MPERVLLECHVNGEQRSLRVHSMARLLDVVRDDLGLTGTKEGCGEGECGACAVLVDGELVNSCLIPAIQVQGSAITTIEGIGSNGVLHAVQQAMIEFGGAQCGICTPGVIMAAVSLLNHSPRPGIAAIRTGLAGNLCRCTGYTRIIDAVHHAVEAAG